MKFFVSPKQQKQIEEEFVKGVNELNSALVQVESINNLLSKTSKDIELRHQVKKNLIKDFRQSKMAFLKAKAKYESWVSSLSPEQSARYAIYDNAKKQFKQADITLRTYAALGKVYKSESHQDELAKLQQQKNEANQKLLALSAEDKALFEKEDQWSKEHVRLYQNFSVAQSINKLTREKLQDQNIIQKHDRAFFRINQNKVNELTLQTNHLRIKNEQLFNQFGVVNTLKYARKMHLTNKNTQKATKTTYAM